LPPSPFFDARPPRVAAARTPSYTASSFPATTKYRALFHEHLRRCARA
jgi:hypothetical protein